MGIKVFKTNLIEKEFEVQALGFLPERIESFELKSIAIFAHGYTSHKGSLLTWASRLVEEGMPVMIFDLPGHYLGGFSEVSNFQSFKESAHALFYRAYLNLFLACSVHDDYKIPNVILGGHSMGALLALKALELDGFSSLNTRAVCVGLGLLAEGKKHLFASNFYKSTLNLRSQLVSPELEPDKLFPWIREEKKNLKLVNKKVHFITGIDDIVVGKGGTLRIGEILIEQGNQVTYDMPEKLPHHFPEQASSFIKKYLKKENLF
ncbi:MAG: alpha/beta fold hydrolase [Bacteriovoracaceae bacterium]|jgi:hypothetical protein|nr:alpha/beta fold hydrolase [Bacteriovoracaceae bacterium]